MHRSRANANSCKKWDNLWFYFISNFPGTLPSFFFRTIKRFEIFNRPGDCFSLSRVKHVNTPSEQGSLLLWSLITNCDNVVEKISFFLSFKDRLRWFRRKVNTHFPHYIYRQKSNFPWVEATTVSFNFSRSDPFGKLFCYSASFPMICTDKKNLLSFHFTFLFSNK